MRRGTMPMPRGNLEKHVLEIPLPEPEEELAATEELPPRKVPYTLHILSSFPGNKHLHEESDARKFIESKVTHAFAPYEGFMRHVEVHLEFHERFRRERGIKHKKQQVVAVTGEEEDEDAAPLTVPAIEEYGGAKQLAPYMFKVTVTLVNKKTIVLANPSKHAQPTLTAGVDHMVDVIKKNLREAKEKMLRHKRMEGQRMAEAMDDDGDDDAELNEELTALADAEAEKHADWRGTA